MKEVTRQNRKTNTVVTHYVFESTTEAIDYLTDPEKLAHLNVLNQDLSNPLKAFRNWWEGDRWEWVKSDDGAVLQILAKYDWDYGTFKVSGNPKWMKVFRVVVGTYYKKSKIDGTITMETMKAFPKVKTDIVLNPQTIGGNVYIGGKFMNKQKKKFAYYCVVYGNPILAWRKATGRKAMASKPAMLATYRQAMELFKDDLVIKEITKYLKLDDFKTRLAQAMDDNSLDINKIVSKLSEGLDKAKPGSMSLAKFIEMSLNLSRYVMDNSGQLNPDGSSVKQIPKNESFAGLSAPEPKEADFIDMEIPPPLDDIKDIIDNDTKEAVNQYNTEVAFKLFQQQKEKFNVEKKEASPVKTDETSRGVTEVTNSTETV